MIHLNGLKFGADFKSAVRLFIFQFYFFLHLPEHLSPFPFTQMKHNNYLAMSPNVSISFNQQCVSNEQPFLFNHWLKYQSAVCLGEIKSIIQQFSHNHLPIRSARSREAISSSLDCGMQCSAVSSKGSGSPPSPPPPPPPPPPSRHSLSECCLCAGHKQSSTLGGKTPVTCACYPK